MSKKNKIPIKVITLDFWNTMYSSHHVDKTVIDKRKERKLSLYKNLASRYNKQLTDNEIEEAVLLEQEISYDIWKHEQRTMPLSERIGISLDKLGLSLTGKDFEELCNIYENFIFEHPPTVAPNLHEIVKTLSDRGFKLGVISDTGYILGRSIRHFLQKADLLKYFSTFSFSDETGVAKPHPESYIHILRNIDGVKPEEVLHIGDLEPTDVKGALNMNMFAGIYTGLARKKIDFDHFSTEAHIHINDWKHLPKLITLK